MANDVCHSWLLADTIAVALVEIRSLLLRAIQVHTHDFDVLMAAQVGLPTTSAATAACNLQFCAILARSIEIGFWRTYVWA